MTVSVALLRMSLALAATGVVGWSILRLIGGGLTRMERAAWSIALGLLAQSAIFVGLRFAGGKVGAGSILFADALVVVASLAVRRPRPDRPARVVDPGDSRAVAVLAAVAAVAWALFLVQAIAEPMWATDHLAIWGLKGKLAFLAPALRQRLFLDPALAWSHPEYPLLVPLSLAAFAGLVGAWNDQALALLWPACELATLLALAGFLGRRVSRPAGAGAAALTALCFPLYGASNVGTAEVPLAFALVLVCCALLDVLEVASPERLARLAAAALFCVSIKQEGSAFVLFAAVLLFVLLRRRSRSVGRGVAVLLVPLAVHWGLLRFVTGPQTRRDFDFSLLFPDRWPELPARAATVVVRLAGTEAVAAMIPLLAIAGYLLVTRRGIGESLWPVFAAQLCCYAAAFTLSAFGPNYAIDSAFRRLVLTLFPAFTLLLFARGSSVSRVIHTGRPPSVVSPNPEGISSRPSIADRPPSAGGATG